MLTQNNIPRFTLIPGILIAGLLIISACSSPQNQEASTVEPTGAEELVAQAVENTPTDTPEEIIPTTAVEELALAPTAEPSLDNGEQAGAYPPPRDQFPTPSTDSGANPYPSPDQSAPPPVKTGLEATNPATVVLETGKPQLIEFFAFW